MTDYKRQTDIFNPADFSDRHVTIIGLGNIGSHSALALARMGIKNFTIIDFDEVEVHNLASQAYPYIEVGNPKTSSLMVEMRRCNPDVQVEIINEPFQKADVSKLDIVVCAVDSMDTRYEIVELIRERNPFVIDGRMGGGQIEVHAQFAEAWEATLTRDADTDPCSARYISYTSYIIAGAIANTLKRHLLGQRLAKRLLMHVDTWEIITEFYEQANAD